MNNVTRKRRNSTPVRASRQSQVRRRLSFGGALPGVGSASFSYSSDDLSASGASLGAAITGGGSSKTSGFISTKLKASRKKKDKFNTLGTTIVREVGGIVNGGVSSATAGNVVGIGHASCPTFTAHEMIWRAIIKKLLIRMGIHDLADFNGQLFGVIAGDLIQVAFRLDPDSTETLHNITVGPGANTANSIAGALATYFRGIYDPNISFQYIGHYSSAQSRYTTVLNLKNCKLVFQSKSTLKIQNNTVEGSGDEDSVNNVPLHGKAYFGSGTGTESYTRDALPSKAGVTFRADNLYGALAKVPTEKWYQEVVPASHFTGVQQYGKVVLEPGHVKTSVLTFYGTFSLNLIYRKLFGKDASLEHPKTSAGTYRFMLLEKMIQATTPAADNAIRVSYEVNLRMGCYAVMSNNYETSQLNDVSNLAAEM